MINYFAYGSNIDREDLDKWCRRNGVPLAKRLGEFPAKLGHYRRTFNYLSTTRNGGAANIMESAEHSVYGLLMEVKEDDVNAIRKKEGYPNHYQEIYVDVEMFDGTMIRDVRTYKVVKHLEELEHQPPTREYLQLIIGSAKRYGFPVDYIEYLKSIETKD